ncbi:unnamed protein product [Linum tenue]|uniref:Uncharacterized protein n=1 Tax=Linum tenue TaxID=586396 RepID=A0AAV0IIS2_9ROSI|nr:unnamed protein product [Linum tenue]
MQPDQRLRLLRGGQAVHHLQVLAADHQAYQSGPHHQQLREGERRRRGGGVRPKVPWGRGAGRGAVERLVQQRQELLSAGQDHREREERGGEGGGRVRFHGGLRRRPRLPAAVPQQHRGCVAGRVGCARGGFWGSGRFEGDMVVCVKLDVVFFFFHGRYRVSCFFSFSFVMFFSCPLRK